MNAEIIQEEIFRHCGIKTALRWKIIATELKGELPKALQIRAYHVSVRREDMAAAKFVLTRKIFARHRRSHFIGGSSTAATKERRSSQQILKLQSRLTRHCRLVSKMVSYLLFSFFWLKIVGIHSTIKQNLSNLLSSLFQLPFWAETSPTNTEVLHVTKSTPALLVMASLDFVASAAVARNPSGNRTSVAKPRRAECQGLRSGETIPILVSPISAKSAFHHRNRSKGVAQRNHNVIAT
jgi:hypothetical protein